MAWGCMKMAVERVWPTSSMGSIKRHHQGGVIRKRKMDRTTRPYNAGRWSGRTPGCGYPLSGSALGRPQRLFKLLLEQHRAAGRSDDRAGKMTAMIMPIRRAVAIMSLPEGAGHVHALKPIAAANKRIVDDSRVVTGKRCNRWVATKAPSEDV